MSDLHSTIVSWTWGGIRARVRWGGSGLLTSLSLLVFSAAAATAILSDSNLAAASWRRMQAIADHVTTQRESSQAETEASAITDIETSVMAVTDIETSVMAVAPPRIAAGVMQACGAACY
jgi:hypothetical protein